MRGSARSLSVALITFAAICLASPAPALSAAQQNIQHVILISVDGLHALDLANFIKPHPDSTLASLVERASPIPMPLLQNLPILSPA